MEYRYFYFVTASLDPGPLTPLLIFSRDREASFVPDDPGKAPLGDWRATYSGEMGKLPGRGGAIL